MKILIVTPYLPWPINTGGNAAQFATLKCLQEQHQFTLVAPVYDQAGITSAGELQAQLKSVKIRAVFCGNVPPKRTIFFKGAAWLARRGKAWLVGSHPPAMQSKIFYPFAPLPENLIAAMEVELAQGTDIFQAEFAETLGLAASVPKSVPKLFINHQIHFVYSERSLEAAGRTAHANYLDAMWRTQEIAHLRHFDGVITFSETDRDALLPYLPAGKLFVSPFPMPADIGIAQTLPANFNGRFLFVASEKHSPNQDAMEWLVNKIWPEILRRMPAAKLAVIGEWNESARAKFAAPGLEFSGFVDDLATAIRGGIMLVPLRIGSGIRVKIMVSLAQGVPVVTTSVGCEGMLAADGKELLVRDEADEFAAAAVKLANEPELFNKLAISGREAVMKNYSPAGVRERRNQIYAALVRGQNASSPVNNQILMASAQ